MVGITKDGAWDYQTCFGLCRHCIEKPASLIIVTVFDGVDQHNGPIIPATEILIQHWILGIK